VAGQRVVRLATWVIRSAAVAGPTERAQYAARVSGSILDRLDLQVEVPALTSEELLRAECGAGEERVSALRLAEALQYRAYEGRRV
jgi:magnesium chelatase family protein